MKNRRFTLLGKDITLMIRGVPRSCWLRWQWQGVHRFSNCTHFWIGPIGIAWRDACPWQIARRL